MSAQGKVTSDHLNRLAYLYVRQSSLHQVHENRESTARQYDLKRRAQALGWTSDQIVVIDEDLGLSGASASTRNGFQRLVAEVELGRAGLVMGLEVSRLARNSTDWHRLLEICALADTLILDEDGIYDPSHFNDRLLLGLKGTMSEAELHVLRARLLFDTFRRVGSAVRVVRHFSTQGILWPRRLAGGPRAGEIVFGPLDHSRVLQILHNPRYAGAYVYGRTRQRKVAIGAQHRYRRLPREEWKVFLPNSYEGYISWEEYEANLARLLDNANSHGSDRRKSPPREGAALLQGLIICGHCGGRMTVRYYIRKGHPVPDYVCQRRSIQAAQHPCQIIPGTGLDDAIAQLILEAVNPSTLEVALQVFEELRERKAEIHRIRQAQVERAREEAELAGKQYMLVQPENRLVADTLEKRWNEKLAHLARVEEEYARFAKQDMRSLMEEDKERIQTLVSDLPRVWRDSRTSARDRKRMLRLLIEDITLARDTMIRIRIRWKGGATTSLNRPLPQNAADLYRTPASIVEQVRALATQETDCRIAEKLNARGQRSGKGKPFTPRSVKAIRATYGIESFYAHLRKSGWLSEAEMAKQLGVHPTTAHRFAHEGMLRALRANDKGELLFEPITGPAPKTHPGKRFKDRPRPYQSIMDISNGV